MERPRLFPPGEGWSYHGSNYIVLRLLVEEATGMTLRDALRQRILAPLGLERTDLVEGPLRGDCARGYLPPDNPVLPGGTEPVDVTEIDVPFHRAGGGVVSTAGEIARMLRAQLGGELLPDRLRKELLDAVDSDWEETDRYGLGIGEITSLMGRQRSPCGAAWGPPGLLGRIHGDRPLERRRRTPSRDLCKRHPDDGVLLRGVLGRRRPACLAPLLQSALIPALRV